MSLISSHRDRLERCLSDAPLDRIPVALWRHFPVDDQDPLSLAEVTVQFQKWFDFDFVKLSPASSYCLQDWGVKDVWLGATEGTREYIQRVVVDPEDWEKLPLLNPHSGVLGKYLDCLNKVVSSLGPETPVIMTIFTPLAQAKNLAGNEELLTHLRQYPQAVHTGLRIITESTRRFIEAAIKFGIAGIFYAVQHARYALLSIEEYAEFGIPYDLELLQAASHLWLNVLHLHGNQVMFDQLVNYPVAVMNWHDRETSPSLAEGHHNFPGVVCGGLQRDKTMVLGTPEDIRREAQEAIQVTGGQRFILGTGCVIPVIAPIGNLLAARRAVDL